MAPSVYHRLRWRRGGKTDVVLVAHRLFLAGSSCLGAGLVAAVFLIGDVLFGVTAAIVAAVAIGLLVLGSWYVLPTSRSRRASIRLLE
jgi:hypothetical protein